VQGRNIADGGHPTQVVLPFEGADVLCEVQGWHRPLLPRPCLFLEPVTEDELEVKDEQPRSQANSVLMIQLVLEPRLHAFETAEHGAPGHGDSMPVTTQGTKGCIATAHGLHPNCQGCSPSGCKGVECPRWTGLPRWGLH
jgi:hypothetical protein